MLVFCMAWCFSNGSITVSAVSSQIQLNTVVLFHATHYSEYVNAKKKKQNKWFRMCWHHFKICCVLTLLVFEHHLGCFFLSPPRMGEKKPLNIPIPILLHQFA